MSRKITPILDIHSPQEDTYDVSDKSWRIEGKLFRSYADALNYLSVDKFGFTRDESRRYLSRLKQTAEEEHARAKSTAMKTEAAE